MHFFGSWHTVMVLYFEFSTDVYIWKYLYFDTPIDYLGLDGNKLFSVTQSSKNQFMMHVLFILDHHV